jgi:integrase/recombinase XerD
VASGSPRRADSAVPSDALGGFLNYLKAECGLAANTVAAYRRDLTRFLAWYPEHGPARLQDVELALFTDYLADLRESGLAVSTQGRHLVSIKMFFRYLMLEGIVRESVVDLLNGPKLWEQLPKVLSPEKVDALLDAPDSEDRFPRRDRAILAMLYATGCRATEVCTMTLRDVRLDEAFCRCLGKGNKERLVSLNPVAIQRVRDYLEHERAKLGATSDDAPLFLSGRGRRISRLFVWKLVKRSALRAGISRSVSPHTLRHSFATHMLAGGAEIRALQELMGHASIRTTQIYTHVDHSRLKSIHEQCHPRG